MLVLSKRWLPCSPKAEAASSVVVLHRAVLLEERAGLQAPLLPCQQMASTERKEAHTYNNNTERKVSKAEGTQEAQLPLEGWCFYLVGF